MGPEPVHHRLDDCIFLPGRRKNQLDPEPDLMQSAPLFFLNDNLESVGPNK